MVRLRAVALAAPFLAASSFLAGPAAAERIHVAPGELGRALSLVKPGDEIVLGAGTHRGRFEIHERLRLRGEDGASIEGTGEGTVLTLAADGIELSDVTVRGSGADLATDDAVVLILESQDVTVERTVIEARGFGIYLRGGGGHHIRDNRVQGDPSLPPNRRGNGVHLWRSQGNEVSGNHIADTRDGVYLSFAHENRISQNEGSGLRYGIHYMYSERNVLSGNRFAHSTGGIALMFSLGNRIENNVTDDNRDFGILAQQLERSILSGNHASGNGRGLYLENAAANEVTENELVANGVGVYLTAGSERNAIHENVFDSNLVQVYREHSGENRWSENGRGNYWSDYVGIDWNGDGVGEVPYRLETATSALMARRPHARILWLSPLLSLLDWWDQRVLLAREDSLDRFPLVARRGSP